MTKTKAKPAKGETTKPRPLPAAPSEQEPGPSKDDPRWKTVLPFVRGVCALLPNEVPDADQQFLVAIAVRMSAFDRDKLLQILERGVA